MKTITVSTQAKQINDLLSRARQENLIVRSADGSEFIVAEIDDFNREVESTRQNKKLMGFLDLRASQDKTIPIKDVKIQLGLSKQS